MLQNVFVAGHGCCPEALGIRLTSRNVVAKPKVMKTLIAVEAEHPDLAHGSLSTFFTGELREDGEK